MLRLMPIAQEQSSVGIKALRNIVEGPAFESASITDEDLGAIKGIIRDSGDAKTVGLAKLAVEQLGKAVDKAAERAGPEAVAALKKGASLRSRSMARSTFRSASVTRTPAAMARGLVNLSAWQTPCSARRIARLTCCGTWRKTRRNISRRSRAR
jgi:hypothetical protein